MAKLFNNRDTSLDSVEWDAIIVGSGPGGLTCASMLGKYGNNMKTLVLEAHDEGVPGGCMHSFNCGGIQFCSGVHYISIHGASSAALWKDITGGQDWIDDHEGTTDTLWIEGKPTSFGPKNWETIWGIKKKELFKLSKYFTWIVLVKILWYPFAVVAWKLFTYFGKSEAEMDWAEWCKKKSGEKKVNPIWFTQSGDWGSVHNAQEPGRSPALIAGAVAKHYANGLSYPKGGYPETVRRMVKVCIERGSTILTDAKVDKITFDSKGRANGVSVKGVNLKAKRVVVSGAHALQNLTGDKCPASLTKAIDDCGESAKHGVVFLAYKGKTAKDLGIDNTGVQWINNRYFMSYKEQKSATTQAIEGTGVYLLWEMPYLKRGPDYLEEKERLAEEAKDYIFKIFPKLSEYDDEDASTPATTEHYVQGRNGASYGLGMSSKRFFDFDTVRALRPETEIPGVFLTGQDSLMLGVAGGLSTGVITAQAILYPSVIDVVVRGKNLMGMLVKEYKKNNSNKIGSTSTKKTD